MVIVKFAHGWLELDLWVFLKFSVELFATTKSEQAQLPIRNLQQIEEPKTSISNR